MKLDHLFIQYIRVNSKWMENLNVKLKTIKVIEENIGSKISDFSGSGIFSDVSPWARKTKEQINKWDYIKLNHVVFLSDNGNGIILIMLVIVDP